MKFYKHGPWWFALEVVVSLGIATALALIIAYLTACASVGTLADQTERRPGWENRALNATVESFATSFPDRAFSRADIKSVTWVYDDQCGKGVPSIRWGNQCLRGLNIGCDLYIAYRELASDTALPHEVAHCHSFIHNGNSDGEHTDTRYTNALLDAIDALKGLGL